MNNFYVYIYLDPRKPGRYEYGKYCFLFEPFYVGKGHGNRLKDVSGRNKYFKKAINKIKEKGLEPIVIKLKENLNEKESFILESELIKLIGRKDLNEGLLLNFTNGGEGSVGYIHTKEWKIENSKRMKGDKNYFYGKHFNGKNNPFYGKNHSEENKRKNSNRMKGKFSGKKNPMYGVRLSGDKNGMFGKNHSEETRKLQSEKAKGKYLGENGPNSILTEKNVIEIWKHINEEILTQKEIGEMFGVTSMTISYIKNRKTWKHIKIK